MNSADLALERIGQNGWPTIVRRDGRVHCERRVPIAVVVSGYSQI